MKATLIALMLLAAVGSMSFAREALDLRIADYQTRATLPLDAQRGAQFWQRSSPSGQNCQSCHGKDLTQPGKHQTTGKTIAPMAISVNTERLSNEKFIEKWLYRNCKAVWSRECTDQEKGDVLYWLSQQ